jgi:hypothetical protein
LAVSDHKHYSNEELSMKKILSAVLAVMFTFAFGAAFAADAPAAAPAAKKEVCKDKAGKEIKCPEKKAK